MDCYVLCKVGYNGILLVAVCTSVVDQDLSGNVLSVMLTHINSRLVQASRLSRARLGGH